MLILKVTVSGLFIGSVLLHTVHLRGDRAVAAGVLGGPEGPRVLDPALRYWRGGPVELWSRRWRVRSVGISDPEALAALQLLLQVGALEPDGLQAVEARRLVPVVPEAGVATGPAELWTPIRCLVRVAPRLYLLSHRWQTYW